MSRSVDTNDIEIRLDEEVTIVFRKIVAGEITGFVKSESVEEILPRAKPLEGGVQYFRIDTSPDFKSEGIIKIRIKSEQATLGQIFEWRRGWEDRTLYCVNVGDYKIIVGVTDHLSGFGIH